MIKFSEMPYTRPSIADIQTAAESICKRIETAASAEEQIAAYSEFETLSRSAQTMMTLAYIRHTVDTRDEFYDAENEFADEAGPQLEEINLSFSVDAG